MVYSFTLVGYKQDNAVFILNHYSTTIINVKMCKTLNSPHIT